MNRTQFTFYESFYEALQRIRGAEDRALAYDILCAYALYGREPDLERLPDAVAITFHLIKPNLDASRRKASGGAKGSPKKDTGKKGQRCGKDPQKTTQRCRKDTANKGEDKKEKEKERENELEKEKELETENKCYLSGPLRGESKRARSVPTLEQVEEAAKLAGCPEIAKAFFDYYAAADWRDSEGRPVYFWQQKLQAWKLREEKRRRPDTPQRRRSWVEIAEDLEERERMRGMEGQL